MYYEWKPYVPVGTRLANAKSFAAKQAKKEGRELAPVKSSGRKMVTSFWGKGWCDNLDRYSDFANRLARGRTYLGNGSVVDLQIKPGLIQAIVAGSETYQVEIKIKTLAGKVWQSLKKDCARSIHSLLDLLQGKFDEGVMQRLVQPTGGLFPQPTEIEMHCSCPDYAAVCKHLAAVVYGVGVRLDAAPEMLFTLRNVDHSELITQAVAAENLEQTLANSTNTLGSSDLSELFGIDLATAAPVPDLIDEKSSKPLRPKKKRKASVVVTSDTTKPAVLKATALKTKAKKPRPQAAAKRRSK